MENAKRVNYEKFDGVRRVDHRREKAPRFKISRRKIFLVGFIVVAVLIGFRMATMEANLELFTTFSVPEGVSLEGIGEGISDKWAAVIDGKVVLFDKEEKRQATASTTKMILALAVMEKKPFSKGEKGETITITQEMYDIWGWYLRNNGSNTKVEVGEEISEYDALVSTLLVSSNNMADSLAIWAFGSIEEYQKYATEMLERNAVKNTTLGTKDASGYDESTVSTASDLARIGYLVMKEPVLAEIVALKKAEVPVAGEISNTNLLLGKSGIAGIKTGYIGDVSGYCIISGYVSDEHIYTVALLGADTRNRSFNENLVIVEELQEKLVKSQIVEKEAEVGYYESWWTGKVPVSSAEDFSEVNYQGAETKAEVSEEKLNVSIDENKYEISLDVPEFSRNPSILQRFLHVFGWKK
ncbi:D-alanyl-D-alanine carboxypeptidase [Candidatus Saccharibacteria bacterium]|nr:D-alanyl-D-alanine carboxypeptidase [Candidatus Saccharibacteria bacterium]